MAANLAGCLQELESGYGRVLALYQQLLVRARAFRSDLEAGRWSQLESELHKRRELIAEIERKEERLRLVRQEIQQELGLAAFTVAGVAAALEERGCAQAQATFDRLGRLLSQVKTVIEELNDLEKGNETALRQLMEGVQVQLGKLHKGRQAARAYKLPQPGYGTARFVDAKK